MPVTFSLVEVTAGTKPAAFRPPARSPAPWPFRKAARRGRSTGRDARRIRRPRKCRDRWCAACRRRRCRDCSRGPPPWPRPALGRMPTAMTTRSAGKMRPVLQLDAGDSVCAEDGLGIGAGVDVDAARLDGLLEQIAGAGIELALHQGRHQMHDRNLHALEREARRRFEAEQPAADDHGTGRPCRRPHACVSTSSRSRKVTTPLQIGAGNRNDEGLRAGGDDQLVIGDAFRPPPSRRSCAARSMATTGSPERKRDAMLRVPGVIVDDDVLKGLFARQHRRKHDAIVIDARLGAEHRDVQSARGCLAKSSSMARPAAMPLPITTSFVRFGEMICLSHGTPLLGRPDAKVHG